MINKKTILSLLLLNFSVYAVNNIDVNASNPENNQVKTNQNIFLDFDNQIAVKYMYSNVNLYNPAKLALQQNYNNKSLVLEVESLFNNGAWIDAEGLFLVQSSRVNNSVGFLGNIQMLGQPAQMIAKIGYGFIPNQSLQIKPYLSVGKVLNYNGITVPDAGLDNSFYYLVGGGIRVEYALNKWLMVYADQLAGYLSDQSQYSVNLDAWDFTSTLGAKFNIAPYLQLGFQGVYNQINIINQDVGYDPISFTYRNTNQNTLGGIFSIGYNYSGYNDAKHLIKNSLLYKGEDFLDFDNWFSLGFGYAQSNSYNTLSQQHSVNSVINFLDLSIEHLFLNNIWLNFNTQFINNLSQSNQSKLSMLPQYLTYPGSLIGSLGYAFLLVPDKFQIIPFFNLGLIMNVNAYTVKNSVNISSQLAKDSYYQYGGGLRFEYLILNEAQLYLNQLVANLSDNSGVGIGVWRSSTTGGVNFHIYEALQMGVSVFYDTISPTDESSEYNSSTNKYYKLHQDTFGGMLNIGLRY